MDVEACFIIGTRAQLVKMAPVIRQADSAALRYCVWFTGQHSESMDELVRDFELKVDQRFFGRVGERATITSLVRWIPSALWECWKFLRRVRRENRKALVVVHGDTLSTLLGALAAKINGLRVAHVESGLTSRRLLSPFPEEVTRRWVFRLTDVAYCPNAGAFQNMSGRRRIRAFDTRDNTIIDSLRMVLARKRVGDVQGPSSKGRAYLVFSVHRFENIYDRSRFEEIIEQMLRISRHFDVWFVLHPATRRRIEAFGFRHKIESESGVRLSPRLPYTEFVRLIAGASVVVTDGGSNQEELAYLGIPTILLRVQSERPDGLGRNAILERDIGDSIEEFVLAGRHEVLRRPSALEGAGMPSNDIVQDLILAARHP